MTRFYGACQDRAHIYLVMELCPGGDLLELLLREGQAMSERRVAVDYAAPLLFALARMHALHVIHRCARRYAPFFLGSLATDGQELDCCSEQHCGQGPRSHRLCGGVAGCTCACTAHHPLMLPSAYSVAQAACTF